MDAPRIDPQDPYAILPELYDLEHDEFADDIALWRSFADAVDGPILEMGVGTGRIAIALAEAGHTVVGIDRSTAMLERARTRLAGLNLTGSVDVRQQQMVDVGTEPDSRFGLILFSLNSLLHLEDAPAQDAALAAARSALSPDGMVLIDVLFPSPAYLMQLDRTQVHEGSWTMPDRTVVDKWSWREVHVADQCIATTLWYDLFASDGSFRRVRTAFDMRYVTPSELFRMLETAGFDSIRAYGSYELDPLYDNSDRLIVTANRAHEGA